MQTTEQVKSPKATRLIDYTGQRFGRLVVVSRAENIGPSVRWNCRCDCGNEKTVQASNLRSNAVRSCGCLRVEETRKRKTKHGMARKGEVSSEWNIWSCMKSRCTNPNHTSYPLYGARGIKVCDRWMESFENFLQDMGKRPSVDASLDRIDNNGNYCPENCRWATNIVQSRNTRHCRMITAFGMTKTLIEWSEFSGLKREAISRRIDRGWPEWLAVSAELQNQL